jgi:hypothetical protein
MLPQSVVWEPEGAQGPLYVPGSLASNEAFVHLSVPRFESDRQAPLPLHSREKGSANRRETCVYCAAGALSSRRTVEVWSMSISISTSRPMADIVIAPFMLYLRSMNASLPRRESK